MLPRSPHRALPWVPRPLWWPKGMHEEGKGSAGPHAKGLWSRWNGLGQSFLGPPTFPLAPPPPHYSLVWFSFSLTMTCWFYEQYLLKSDFLFTRLGKKEPHRASD